MKARLIHPMKIYVARLLLQSLDDQWDDDFHTRDKGSSLKWEEDSAKWLPFLAQVKKPAVKMYSKKSGGYEFETRLTFLLYTKDVLDSSGEFKLDRGDKIVKIEDLHGVYRQSLELFVRECVPRGEYRSVNFLELHCEKMLTGGAT